jgi:hypothetical protein
MRVAGHARLRVVNDGPRALPGVSLWLYPNALATRAPALTDVSFHWLYPGGFSPAGIAIRNARVDGAPVDAAITDVAGVGARVLAQLPLAAPLAPGAAVTVDLDFDTRLPRRLGSLGCDGVRCRLMGGFYPTPARDAGPSTARPDEPRVARAGRLRMTVRAPAGLALVVAGRPVPHPDAAPVVVEEDDALVPTIVTDRVLRPSAITVGGHAVRVLFRRPRPPPSEDQVLPYVREDIPGLVLDTAARALAFADAVLGASASASPAARALPITLVEAPLRHELVQAHGDVILVSDQIFGIFPINRFRKYHRLEIARAIFTLVADEAIRAHERPGDRERAAGILAAYLTEVYAVSQFDRLEYAAAILRPYDFVPAVDQLLYAPLLASSSSYFGDVDDDDRVRDGVGRFAAAGAPPRLVYNKLLDLLGPERFRALARRMLVDGVPLRAAAAAAFGGDLGWFWTETAGPWPRVNYRLSSVKTTPGPAGAHVVVDVTREGADVREPVELRIDSKTGGAQTLRWDDDAPAHRFEADAPGGLASVEIDPRGRLVESAVGSLRASDDPRYDDRQPPRWRFIYEGFGALFDVSNLTARFEAAVLLKPQHDLRREIVATAFHDEVNEIGARVGYGWNFGPQADKNNLVSQILATVAGARLDPSFGQAVTATPQPGWRLSGRVGWTHDTRDYLFDPWRAVGIGVSASYALTALDGGARLSQVGAGLEVLRLHELAPGHVLALDASTQATFGDVRLPSQLPTAGGLGALRGYFADELLARANVMGHLELRDDYLTGLDWNLLHFTTVRGLAGTVFTDAAAITTCDGYAFSRDRVYADVGYSFRVLHDAFGVYQQLLSLDVAVPLVRNAGTDACAAVPSRPPFSLLVSFFPSF